MDHAAAEKIARNNAAFREANDGIETAASSYGFWDGRPVPFLCECSDDFCVEQVTMQLSRYETIREDGGYVLAPGHVVE